MGQWDLSQLSLVADPGSVRGLGGGPVWQGRSGVAWQGGVPREGGLAQTLRLPLGFQQRYV